MPPAYDRLAGLSYLEPSYAGPSQVERRIVVIVDREQAPRRSPERSRRAAALALDLGVLFVLEGAAAALATAWLLVRSSWGRFDVGVGDAYIATALLGAIPPAWGAWQAWRFAREGATFGQVRMRLAVDSGEGPRRFVRLVAHPASLPCWGWLWVTLLLLGLPWLPVLARLGFVLVLGAAVLSAATMIARPHWPPLHDRLAGTRVVRTS
jgi:hypothetical protein